MNNYIFINGKCIELTDEQVKQLMGQDEAETTGTLLSEISEGDICQIGGQDFVVLEHIEGVGTAIIRRELLPEETSFDESDNSYDGSNVDRACNEFAESLAAVVGADNIVEHEVDLTADDGLKDYGVIRRKVSVLTAERYRRYVYILDKFKVDAWQWLATACSTKAHDWYTAVKCVSPSGYMLYDCYNVIGVRPFCILKSNIFVSK